jgi:hypothetical protein
MIEHRAQALATVFLTGRNNVEVIRLPDLGELDMLCRVVSDDDSRQMPFGVILRATSDPSANERWAEMHLNSRFRGPKAAVKYPFPVLVLLFSMPSDDGYYAWRMEPELSASTPVLILNERFACEKASRSGLDSIVEKVRSWYEAYYQQVVRVKR